MTDPWGDGSTDEGVVDSQRRGARATAGIEDADTRTKARGPLEVRAEALWITHERDETCVRCVLLSEEPLGVRYRQYLVGFHAVVKRCRQCSVHAACTRRWTTSMSRAE